MANMLVFLDEGFMNMADHLARDRRARCRELGRVDQSSGKTYEERLEKELLGAAGELAFAKAFNLCTDFGVRSGGADFFLHSEKTVDVKTIDSPTSNLLVRSKSNHYDVYVLIEKIGYIMRGQFVIRGWASGDEVRASPIGERAVGCHCIDRGNLRVVDSNCPNFFEAANRLELPAARQSSPPPPLSEPFESCKFQPVVQP